MHILKYAEIPATADEDRPGDKAATGAIQGKATAEPEDVGLPERQWGKEKTLLPLLWDRIHATDVPLQRVPVPGLPAIGTPREGLSSETTASRGDTSLWWKAML